MKNKTINWKTLKKLNLVLHQQQQQQQTKEAENNNPQFISQNEQAETTEIKTLPKIEIYPPIRVRLQKLNEKRVALKWSMNPKNALIELTGYNIYINGKLCGKMGPNDTIASINGINQEGEYRIHIRSFYANTESEDSNEVVTRVKRKQPSLKTSASIVESEETNNNNDTTGSSEGPLDPKNLKQTNKDEQIKYKSQQNAKTLEEEIATLKPTIEESSSKKSNFKFC